MEHGANTNTFRKAKDPVDYISGDQSNDHENDKGQLSALAHSHPRLNCVCVFEVTVTLTLSTVKKKTR